ncbi:hypothetical protein KP509_23G058600 [Ceratopteris richardii]|uniref:Uncharacterized protein n=3 Tax=Ceratopteris richardii TaxID=49495 RepID=A0A8T2S068_CERRI|nr:hypothetical protein KP509_23G058600 [Ceratopteris richardii]
MGDSNDKSGPEQQLSLADLGAALPGGKSADWDGLRDMLKDKLQTLAGQHSNILETLSPNVRKRVEALQDIQGKHDELEKKFLEERDALEARYQKLYEPLYSKRYEIVTGITEPEGVVAETVSDSADAKKDEEKGVPEFWLSAMKTNETLAMQITERDEEALKYLRDIRWCKINEPKGFKLEFLFDSNPFFKNSVLTKTYHMIEEDEPILERAIGTEIEWLPGKNLTQKVLRKKPKKGAKNPKPITKTECCESFFNFFNPPEVPDDNEDIDQDTAEQLQDIMEQDYDIGSTIRDKIIPHAVSWFTGEALQAEEFEDIEDDDDEESEDVEDEDEEEDDENEETEEEKDSAKPQKSSASTNSASKVGQKSSGEQPPECKQQ